MHAEIPGIGISAIDKGYIAYFSFFFDLKVLNDAKILAIRIHLRQI